ncbi:MAG: amidohydrolase family protein [Candidatus Lokiarchaeota archaeon]|nr:amidohydrolase family protein [Candidatus Lokiarchaeota archaeon]MBD3339027.1 amidohydrolase family protein [Candidatus Lokiarchaeota archaeon]
MSDIGIEDYVFFGGTILTMAENFPNVEAVGIKGDKITSVGTLEDVMRMMDSNVKKINLKGKALLPGFIDSHFHIVAILFYYINLDLSNVKSVKELQDLIKKAVREKGPGEFILGLDLNEERFTNSKEQVFPTKHDLDQVAPENPVFLLRYDGHIGVANTKCLDFIGITKETASPEGGEIRKKDGIPTGILTENATGLVISKVPIPDSKDIMDAASKAYKDLAKEGITTIHGIVELDKEGGVANLGGIEVPLLTTVKPEVLQDWYGIVYTAKPKKLKRKMKPPLHEGKIDGKFRIGCLKSWLDGTFGAATALMHEPFTDQPDKTGFTVINEEILYERMVKAHNLGFQIAIHAIGDKANRKVVDLYQKLLIEYPREDHRHRIEHASLLTDDVIKDVKKLGLVLSCQPPFLNSEYTWLEKRIGEERCKYVYPYKTLVENNIIVAAGSDGPVEKPSVVEGLHALVNRNNLIAEQRISMKDALKMYTINGAYAAFEEEVKGTIESGKLANLVILNKNPLEVSKDDVKSLEVIETIIRGKSVYKKIQ